MYDVIIIGRGPAGLAASIYLARAGRKVLVIGKDNPIWNKDVLINNYFAVKEITGDKLMAAGQAQAKGFGAEIIDELVTKVEFGDAFKVTAKKKFESKNLLIATGSVKKKQEISNESDYVGKGVSYCVACDGFFFKDKKVIVVGSTDFALHEALDLLNYTKDVSIITNGKAAEFDKNEAEKNKIKVADYKIEKIIGNKVVEKITTSKGEFKVDGLFIAGGNASSADISRMLGLEIIGDKIKVDDGMKTNCPNVWAAGDCTPGLGQISTAIGKGAVAATSIIKGGRK